MPTGTPTSPREGELLWSPSEGDVETSKMEAFRQLISSKYHLPLKSYRDLHAWSIQNISEFWQQAWDFVNVISSKPCKKVFDTAVPIDQIPTWFEGARLNFAENLLCHRDDRAAIIYESEFEKDAKKITFKELYQSVALVSAALKENGVGVGDTVAAYAANVPEVVIFMLAAASLGAIFTTIPPEFGIAAVKDRLLQTRPKILLASSAVFYNGKVHDQMEKIDKLVQELPCLKQLVLLTPSFHQPATLYTGILYKDFISTTASDANLAIKFEQLPFNHPLYILYSSGTTGKPKCLVHSAGGTLLQHLKEHIIHGNLDRSDVFLQYTTIGWMMWHWLVSTLAIGCAIVLYEGSPFQPEIDQLLKLIDRHCITRFGASAKFIQHLQELKYATIDKDKELSSLKTIYTTGSPLNPSNFRYIYTCIKSDVQVASITGGTDIISLFGASNPLLPVHAGEIQCAGLGMAIAAFTEDGQSSNDDQAGDLVCLRPFPSMPVYFLDDPDGSKYQAAYFDRFPHVWHHGDFVQFNQTTGGIVMLGRSDGTLNPAGVRFGSAELYNILAQFGENVADSLVVGVRRAKETDERVIMFLKVIDNKKLDADLVTRIKNAIRTQLSPRHVPALIMGAPDIPYTLNGKKVEVAVKRILSGQAEISTTSLANPESLDFYRSVADEI